MANEMSREKILTAQGWTRQFTTNEPRLSEAVQMYRELGFEVLLEPLPKEPECGPCEGPEESGNEGCRACFKGVEDQYKIIFTRRLKKGGEEEDDIF